MTKGILERYKQDFEKMCSCFVLIVELMICANFVLDFYLTSIAWGRLLQSLAEKHTLKKENILIEESDTAWGTIVKNQTL